MDREKPDRLVMVAFDIASSLRLIAQELSAVAGDLHRLELSLTAASSSSIATAGGERNLDLEIRYPRPGQAESKPPFALSGRVMAEASQAPGPHGKFCCCVPCSEKRARTPRPPSASEDEMEMARRRR